MNSQIKKWLILILFYVMALIGSIYFTFAYYQQEQSSVIELSTGDVDISWVVSFDGVAIDETSPYYDREHQELMIEASDSSANNALSKLKLSVVVKSEYAVRVRVKLMESYIRLRTYQGTDVTLEEVLAIKESYDGYHLFSQLKKGNLEDVVEREDGYQYYQFILAAHEELSLDLIDGGSMLYARVNSQFSEQITLRLSVVVDVVQANRYQEIWQVDEGVFGQ